MELQHIRVVSPQQVLGLLVVDIVPSWVFYVCRLQGRELEKWVPPADSDGMGLEDVDHGPGKGGAKWDQFQANARLFNVKSTYDEDLYTTKLDVRNSNMTVAEAERLAAEIQSGNTCSAQLNAHLAEERGMEMDDEVIPWQVGGLLGPADLRDEDD